LRSSRPFRRRRAFRVPKPEIWIFCEGGKTEPGYIRDFVRDYRCVLARIEIVGGQGVPLTIANAAVGKRTELLKLARRTRYAFFSAFEVWAVFDVDVHPNVAQAKALCRQNAVGVCVSNPCFELWPIYHFGDWHRPETRHALQKHLKSLMRSYDPDGSKKVNYNELKDSYFVARDRASLGLKKRSEEGSPEGNPSTNFYLLLDAIIKSGTAS